ncbi:unnamed protein product [Notodromas monacha]|uniref:Uncharacterized protein n=1 Tax=Notodromas monacha TaxID=399045 RepID=A0A7R9BPI5_9CRUS|nr:unnamed protein product [Notodromas monacha]CAG0919305.1 unnamed protein product [Notodromas monacha]
MVSGILWVVPSVPVGQSSVQASLPGAQYSYQFLPQQQTHHEQQQKNQATSEYQGEKVSKEETEKLHASAIAQQKELEAQLAALISGGGSKQSSYSSSKSGGGSKQSSYSSSSSSSASSSSAAAATNISPASYSVPAAPAIRPVAQYILPAPAVAVQQTYTPVLSGHSQQQVVQTSYTGPIVSKEETEALHAEAIAAQKQIIAAQEAINNAGPAKASDAKSTSYSSGGYNTIAVAQGNSYQTSVPVHHQVVQVSAPIRPAFAIQPATQPPADYHLKASEHSGATSTYTGVKVSKEETEKLHADAIKKQQEIIAQQQRLIAQGAAAAGQQQTSHYQSQQSVGGGAQQGFQHGTQSFSAQVSEQSPGGYLVAYTLPAAGIQQGSAQVQQTGSLGYSASQQAASSSSNQQHVASSSSLGSSSTHQQSGYAVQVSQEGPGVAVNYALPSASISQPAASGVVTEYKGEKVTKEQTEQLHAEAIKRQQEFTQQLTSRVSQTVSNYSPEDSQDRKEEQELLDRQNQEVLEQIALAKAQGQEAEAQGKLEVSSGSASLSASGGSQSYQTSSSSIASSAGASQGYQNSVSSSLSAYQPPALTLRTSRMFAFINEQQQGGSAAVTQQQAFSSQSSQPQQQYSFRTISQQQFQPGQVQAMLGEILPNGAGIRIIGPVVTNYLPSGLAPAFARQGVARAESAESESNSAENDDDASSEAAELAQQDAEVQRQTQEAVEDGLRAAAGEAASFEDTRVRAYAPHQHQY